MLTSRQGLERQVPQMSSPLWSLALSSVLVWVQSDLCLGWQVIQARPNSNRYETGYQETNRCRDRESEGQWARVNVSECNWPGKWELQLAGGGRIFPMPGCDLWLWGCCKNSFWMYWDVFPSCNSHGLTNSLKSVGKLRKYLRVNQTRTFPIFGARGKEWGDSVSACLLECLDQQRERLLSNEMRDWKDLKAVSFEPEWFSSLASPCFGGREHDACWCPFYSRY